MAETGGHPYSGSFAHPTRLSDREAVLAAYSSEIGRAAGCLEGGLSVLVGCEKQLVEHLAAEIAPMSGRVPRFVQLSSADSGGGLLPRGTGPRRHELMKALEEALAKARPDEVIVIPHLGLLAGGGLPDVGVHEIRDLLYEGSGLVVLAFTDLVPVIPEILASRFEARMVVDLLPSMVRTPDGNAVPAGQALVTEAEAALFQGFDETALYRHIAGMNPVLLRRGLRHAYIKHAGGKAARPTFADLLEEVRALKVGTSTGFSVPQVSMADVGGYEDVKAELVQELRLLSGPVAAELPAGLLGELMPHGFLFHGPSGTGKTLLAHAVAGQIGATITTVSGAVILDQMAAITGHRLQRLFAQARHNAPTVLVLDDIDSIASRAGNARDAEGLLAQAVVAVLLAEIGKTGPETPVLVIGITNRLNAVDSRLLTPGPLQPISINLPDHASRRQIARIHARNVGIITTDERLEEFARASHGMTGADIRSIFRQAATDDLLAGHQRADAAQRAVLRRTETMQADDATKAQAVLVPATAWDDDAGYDDRWSRGWSVMGALRQHQQHHRDQALHARAAVVRGWPQSHRSDIVSPYISPASHLPLGIAATRWKGGPTVLALLFAHPDSDAMRTIDRHCGYFDVRTGDTWDLFCPGYYRSARGASYELRAGARPVGRHDLIDWYFNPSDFNDLRKQVEQLSERRWQYSGGTDLVLINGWLPENGEPVIDWESTISGQVSDHEAGVQTLTIANVIERISRDLETAAEDASYGVGEITDGPPPASSHAAREFMINALAGIAAALGARALGG